MLSDELPTRINPEQICRSAPVGGARLIGKMKLSNLDNVAKEFATQVSTEVFVSLLFSVDVEEICCIQGEIAVEIEQRCQRCLQPMKQSVNAKFQVSPVANDGEAKHLPSCYEPLLVHEGEIALTEWIAEELHLALPLVPRHDYQCVSYENQIDGSNSGANPSPFAKLKKC